MSASSNSYRMNVIYVMPGAAEGKRENVFYTPDGRGRVYFDTVNEAKDETGITKVIYLLEDPED